MEKKSISKMVKASLIAALYVVFTMMPPFSAMSFGVVQFRVAEVLMFTALFSPYYAVGLFIGCFISNVFGTANMFDIIFGSLATLSAGIALYKWRTLFLKRPWLAPIPVSLINAIVVGSYLPFLFSNVAFNQLFSSDFTNFFAAAFGATPIVTTIASVFIGEIAVCYVLGLPFIAILKRYKNHLL